MARISFAKNKTSEEDDNSTTVLATTPTKEVATAPSRLADDGYERTADDTVMPYFSLVGKTGALADNFKPGTFCLNKLVQVDSPATVVVIARKKIFREAQPFGGEEISRVFSSAAEVREAGLRVGEATSKVYGEEAAPEVQFLLFIYKPAKLNDESGAFCITLPSGIVGALGMFTCRGSTYRNTAAAVDTLFQQNAVYRAGGLCSRTWELKSDLIKSDVNSWWSAKMAPSGLLGPDDVAFLKEFNPQQ